VQYAVVRQECGTAGGSSPPRHAVPVCADWQMAVGRSAVRRCRAAASRRRAEPRNRRDVRPASWWPAAVPRLSIGIRSGLSIS
jgi:hypothetical protein